MAGNLVSIMSACCSRGGRVSESLPKSRNMRFSLFLNNQNTRYRCSSCGVLLPGFTSRQVKENNCCPCCHTKGSIVTLSRQTSVSESHKRTSEQVSELRERILELYNEDNDIKAVTIAELLEVKYQTVIYHLRCLGISKKQRKVV